MVLRLEVEGGQLADGLERDEVVLTAGGHAVLHDVGDREVRAIEGLLRGVLLGLEFLDLRGQLLGTVEQRGALLGGRLADLLAQGLLLGACVVAGEDRGATGGVGLEQHVDEARVLPPHTLRLADGVGILAEELEVDHGIEAYRCQSSR